ncbi:hypothetical protein MYCTH_2057781 [Thermothelomyces thermophilus ATCC 42464]|uniref:Uncharacterized protein n=1 Tax=Thermothelomyces thermophilus (strain ATCC 42464 / BCRC 31852 / DSM 1799) TaxID=573729 RepID=G2Q8S8_THET4|nr:uncharacterized protein MYCTH_2057781 [Thermothelomyces thermophilus ATCC 42464]AEO56273.1 hypothetical protein MYCTH_2057781 [Thermothelomyces thermophilus ATCC 42464]
MPPKSREYYLTTSSSRDFAWFLFKAAGARTQSKKLAPPSPNAVPKARRAKMAEPKLALLPPAEAKARKQAPPQSRPEPAKPRKQAKPKRAGLKSVGLWSDWYVSEDRSYFWRARMSHNETWDYQFTPGYQEPAPADKITPNPSSGESSQPQSPIPEKRPGSSNPNVSQGPASPKSSLRTILTTSTGRPTEDLSASTSRTLVTLPKEVEDSSQSGTAPVPLAAETKKNPSGSGTKSNEARRASSTRSPVLRLLQEGRSRKNRARAEAARSGADNTAGMGMPDAADVTGKRKQHPRAAHAGNGGNGSGAATVVAGNRTSSAFAKKLRAKVKSEKELKVDPKKRVRTWLKGVEVDWAPIPLDAQGFPIYR